MLPNSTANVAPSSAGQSPTSQPQPDSGQPAQAGAQPAGLAAVVPSRVEALAPGNVKLDGTASTAPNSSALSYLWSLESKPANSAAQMFDRTSPVVQVQLDVVGTYKFKLVVSSEGKSSDPVHVTVDAVAPGATAPFASFKGSGLSIPESMQLSSACSYYRTVANYATFWSFGAGPFDFTCIQPPTVPWLDIETQGGFVGELGHLSANLRTLRGGGISGTLQYTRANANTISDYEYTVSTEVIELASAPVGKATGTALIHAISAGTVTPNTSGFVLYKAQGAFKPSNVPSGWEVAQQMSVLVTLDGHAAQGGQIVTQKVFERTFISDFAETIPLNLNWAQLQGTMFDGSATYHVSVSHQMTFKRTSD